MKKIDSLIFLKKNIANNGGNLCYSGFLIHLIILRYLAKNTLNFLVMVLGIRSDVFDKFFC